MRFIPLFGLIVGGLPELFRHGRNRVRRRHLDNGRGSGL